MTQVAWTDLDTRGFVVTKGFLSDDEMVALRRDTSTSQVQANKNYPLKTVSPEAEAIVGPKIEKALAEINATTTLNVHVSAGSAYFETGTATGVSFPWHQDHESYFIFQNHDDYLNFYMPIVKPDESRSNVRLIPYDVLERDAPNSYRLMRHRGACHLQEAGGRLWWLSDETGAVHLMPKDFDDLGTTPHLAAGDLLVMRGDMVHRTQDADTERVALSCRMVGKDVVISRQRLASGGVRKALMLSNAPQVYQQLWATFDAAGCDAMPVGEMRELIETIDVVPPAERRQFLIQLLGEKRRAHKLVRFAADVPRAAVVRGAVWVQDRAARMRSAAT